MKNNLIDESEVYFEERESLSGLMIVTILFICVIALLGFLWILIK